jgi:hypothetical protein
LKNKKPSGGSAIGGFEGLRWKYNKTVIGFLDLI